MKEYEDIINLSRPISNHKKQPIESRAAQFAPFAALTGYDDRIKEEGRLTSRKKILDQETIEIINENLNYIEKNIKNSPNISITYFVNDNKKMGGKYITKVVKVKRIDKIEKYILLINNEKIYFDNISEISIEKED